MSSCEGHLITAASVRAGFSIELLEATSYYFRIQPNHGPNMQTQGKSAVYFDILNKRPVSLNYYVISMVMGNLRTMRDASEENCYICAMFSLELAPQQASHWIGFFQAEADSAIEFPAIGTEPQLTYCVPGSSTPSLQVSIISSTCQSC